MCGFAVAVGWPEADVTVARLIQGILHRGDITDPLFSPLPDVAMCTRRLRIIDAEHGMQPQISFYGRLAVSFNGEIYNHVALRQEMEAFGVEFKTQSDTEVLANALQIWGHRALERLNGMCVRRGRSDQWRIPGGARSVRRQTALRHAVR